MVRSNRENRTSDELERMYLKAERKGDGFRWPGCIGVDRDSFVGRMVACTYAKANRIESTLQLFRTSIEAIPCLVEENSRIVDRMLLLLRKCEESGTNSGFSIGELYWLPIVNDEDANEYDIMAVVVRGVSGDEATVAFAHSPNIRLYEERVSVPTNQLFKAEAEAISYVLALQTEDRKSAAPDDRTDKANG